MQWIKSHLTLVICGAVSVLAITLLVLGFVLSDVQTLMAQDATTLQQLSRAPAVNEQVINEWEKLRQDNEKQVEHLLEELARVGQHKPLQEDVFPAINPLKTQAPFQFQHAYNQAMQQLLVQLKAKDAPTPAEVNEEAERMEAERQKAESLATLGVEEPKGKDKPGRFGATARQGPSAKETAERRANMSPEELAREDPHVRVSIFKAKSAYCYANLASFNPLSTITAVQKPTVEEMWYAQMALWIEQDIVNALSGLNETYAKKITENGGEAWVGTLPVKHVLSCVVGPYIGGSGTNPLGGGGDTGDMYTPRTSGSSVDVIHFSLDLVVQASLLPEVIDAICMAGFYTPLLVNYEEVPPNTDLINYIYGSDPSIRVHMDIEGCFLRTKYEKWMPESVKTAIPTGNAGSTATPSTGSPGVAPRSSGVPEGGMGGRRGY